MSKGSDWLSIGQAAKYLGVSRDTLRRWEKRGKIKPVRSPSNRRYYTKKQLTELMTGKKAETPQNKLASLTTKTTLSSRQKLLLAGCISFLVATLLALLLQFLILS